MIKKQLKTTNCEVYCKLKNYKYYTLENQHNQKVYIPNYNFSKSEYINCMYPERYYAELLNVNIIGNSNVIFDDNHCICDLIIRFNSYKFDLRDANILFINNKITRIQYIDSNYVIDKGIMLLGSASTNYYHFNIESLTKLCLINSLGLYKNMPLLVDESIIYIPQLYDELLMLNNNEREIILLKSNVKYKVNKLISFSDLSIIPLNIKKGYKLNYDDIILNDIGVNLLHDKLSINNEPNKKIFISRKNTKNHRLKNIDAAELIFKNFDYDIVYPELLSFKSQLDLFSTAKYIAGVTGAGLTNSLFCNSSSIIIDIIPKEIEISCFSNIFGILGQDSFFLDCKLLYNNPTYYYQSDFIINEDYLNNSLLNIHSK
ncbi:glycosyltransferase family 61 protein [Clostridium sp.]|uniref:glycosyltransferase family 61 protein n=1 Tax=Clostridium sp. TaxID=1506 RepID=UPI003F3A2BC3